MRYIIFAFVFIGTFLLYKNVGAEDFPFESSKSTSDEIEKGFSQDNGLSESEQSKSESEKINFGGFIRNEIYLYQFDKKILNRDDYFQDPLSLSLYLDNRFTDDFRMFFRGQFSYDPTADTTNNSISPINGEKEKTTRSQLDELKVQFSFLSKLFVSLGVQKLKWGSGRFWNPSDFLNQEAKSLTEKEDRRAGLKLIKLHLPMDESNFYYIANFGEQNGVQNTAHALRFELPLPSSLTTGELSFTMYGKKNQIGKSSADLSMALGPIDFYIESSINKNPTNSVFVSGASYEWQFTDKNYLVFNLESFYNPEGASSSKDYPSLIANNQFVPFYSAQKYIATSVYLPTPWFFSHTDFSLVYINNQIDESGYIRFGTIWSGYKSLVASFFLGHRLGEANSEFRLGGVSNDYLIRVEYKF